jgi:hypothetical protein
MGGHLKLLKFLLTAAVFALSAHAQAEKTPRVGRVAAAKYFQSAEVEEESAPNMGPEGHYLALYAGTYTSSQAYEWGGHGKQDSVGGLNVGVTYRIGEWHNSMDFNMRIEFQEFKVAGERPTKLSFIPLFTFPDASAKFPLYFGGGIGLGIFMKQIKDESTLSLDYQLIAGARFFNVFENTGFFIESGLKNHLLILSSGQLNGVFVVAGAVFTF